MHCDELYLASDTQLKALNFQRDLRVDNGLVRHSLVDIKLLYDEVPSIVDKDLERGG